MDASLAPGVVVAGRYRVTGLIAEGGMGAVHDAIDERLGRAVALKVVRGELADDRTVLSRFEREAMAAAQLSHPGIVQVHDFGTTPDGLSYLVMERLSGRTLGQILNRDGKLEPSRAVELVEQVLGALEAAHSAGIVHRDLKPGNLMVLSAGQAREVVKVLDFGIARLMESDAYTKLTSTGAIVGTPVFMAPEQARGGPIDARADVYAMGVILYCLLTGRKPFDGADLGEVLKRVLSEPPPRADAVPGVPAELASIAERAMQKDAASRHASAREMAAALVRWRTRSPDLTSVAAAPTLAATAAPTAISSRPLAMELARESSPVATRPIAETEIAPARVPPSIAPPAPVPGAARRWLGRLSWLALAGLVASCALGATGLVAVLALAPLDWASQALAWLPENWSIPHPASIDPVAGPPGMTPVAHTVTDDTLGGPSGACARATACCEEFARLYSHAPSCEVLHAYEQRPRALCDEVRDRYRDSIVQSGGDPWPCD